MVVYQAKCILVKIVLEDGTEGWGEVYAHVQPSVYAGIIREVLASIYLGQNVLHMDVPDDPGLGVTVTTDRAAKFLVDHSIIQIQDVADYSSTVEHLH